MSDAKDDAQLADVGKQLPALDLDATTAEQMARRVRQDLGKKPSPKRFLEPIAVAIVAASALGWAIYQLVERLS
jgi:hypothetical protein